MKETIFSKGEGWRLAALLNINSLKGFFKKLVKEMFKWKVKLNNLHITLQKYISNKKSFQHSHKHLKRLAEKK